MTILRVSLLIFCLTLAFGCTSTSPDGAANSPAAPALTEVDPATELVASVTGAAQWFAPEGFFRRLTFNARQYADGRVDGEWQMVVGATILHGDIICMKVLGNHARIGGFVEFGFFSFFEPNTAFAIEVVDMGEGANALPDKSSKPRAFRNEPIEAAIEFCETGQAPNPIGIEEISVGNIQIWER